MLPLLPIPLAIVELAAVALLVGSALVLLFVAVRRSTGRR